MYKPKEEFFNHYICLLSWPKDLKVYFSHLLPSVYVPAKFERYSIANDREIAEKHFILFSSPCDLYLWPTHLKM